jgi:hypothetical protein
MLLGKDSYRRGKFIDFVGARRAIVVVIARRALGDEAISTDRALSAARDCVAGARNDG